MISKELLSLVLDEEVTATSFSYTAEENQMTYTIKNEKHSYNELNLDTLGRLMKEWCSAQDYLLWSSVKNIGVEKFHTFEKKVFQVERTELEAIIKATEWVAREKGLL